MLITNFSEIDHDFLVNYWIDLIIYIPLVNRVRGPYRELRTRDIFAFLWSKREP